MQTLIQLPFAEAPAPAMSWDFTSLQPAASKLAYVLTAVWFIYLVSQFALPSKRGGMGQRGQGAKMAGAAVVIIVLLKLTLIPDAVNFIIKIAWGIAATLGIV